MLGALPVARAHFYDCIVVHLPRLATPREKSDGIVSRATPREKSDGFFSAHKGRRCQLSIMAV